MTVVLVVGISGVGKTTLCAAYAQTRPQICHLTASRLIARRLKTTVSDLRGMTSRAQLLANQQVLAEELSEERRQIGDMPVLLDGQCVLDTGRDLVVVPPDDLISLNLTALMLLEIELDELLRRRTSDRKQRVYRSADELEVQAGLNRQMVSHYSALLKIPARVVQAELHDFSLATDELFAA